MGIMGGPSPDPAEVEALLREHVARKEQKRQQQQDEQDRAKMPGIAAANQDEKADRKAQERPTPEWSGNKQNLPVADKRSRWETILAPLALAILGLAMIVAAVIAYPRTSEAPAPNFRTFMSVTAHFPKSRINYLVAPLSSATAVINVLVDLPDRTVHPSTHVPAAFLALSLPPNAAFWYCPKPPCTGPVGRQLGEGWNQPLNFNSMSGSAGEAAVSFFVEARNFGITSNGITAAAALPTVLWNGPVQPPLLYAGYGVHSAASYDWSPAAATASHSVIWVEPLAKGWNGGLAATGINHAAQSWNDFKTSLLGL